MISSEPMRNDAGFSQKELLKDLVLYRKIQKDAEIVRCAVKADGESHPDDRLQVVSVDHRGTYAGRECRFKLALPFPLIIEPLL